MRSNGRPSAALPHGISIRSCRRLALASARIASRTISTILLASGTASLSAMEPADTLAPHGRSPAGQLGPPASSPAARRRLGMGWIGPSCLSQRPIANDTTIGAASGGRPYKFGEVVTISPDMVKETA